MYACYAFSLWFQPCLGWLYFSHCWFMNLKKTSSCISRGNPTNNKKRYYMIKLGSAKGRQHMEIHLFSSNGKWKNRWALCNFHHVHSLSTEKPVQQTRLVWHSTHTNSFPCTNMFLFTESRSCPRRQRINLHIHDGCMCCPVTTKDKEACTP